MSQYNNCVENNRNFMNFRVDKWKKTIAMFIQIKPILLNQIQYFLETLLFSSFFLKKHLSERDHEKNIFPFP